ncbi:MAG TPA: PLP-dependent transferase, partial [Actinomycetota bacterium]|nr:PLP-dependent transferase [Actinomycetota bacterium]
MSADPRRSSKGFSTRAVHRRPVPDQDGTPLVPPIDMSSTYSFDDTDAFAKASEQRVGAGYVYTRWANPTVDAFEAA